MFDLHRSQKQISLREHYYYIQIRHFYISHYSLNPSSPPTSFEQICCDSPRGKGLISVLYKTALASCFSSELPYRSKWETDCDEQFAPEDWDTMLDNLHKCTKLLAVREMAYKVFDQMVLYSFQTPSHLPGNVWTMFQGMPAPRYLQTHILGVWATFSSVEESDCYFICDFWYSPTSHNLNVSPWSINPRYLLLGEMSYTDYLCIQLMGYCPSLEVPSGTPILHFR